MAETFVEKFFREIRKCTQLNYTSNMIITLHCLTNVHLLNFDIIYHTFSKFSSNYGSYLFGFNWRKCEIQVHRWKIQVTLLEIILLDIITTERTTSLKQNCPCLDEARIGMNHNSWWTWWWDRYLLNSKLTLRSIKYIQHYQ